MTFRASAVRRAFVVASVGWAIALPLSTIAAARTPPAWTLYTFAVAVYGAGGLVCHQLPERSFHLWSAQMAVCARCTGVYAGAAIAAILVSLRPVRTTSGRIYLLMASVPTVLTLAYEWTTGDMPANWVRAAAGLPLGAAVSLAIVSALDLSDVR